MVSYLIFKSLKVKWKLLSRVWLFATYGLYSPWTSPDQNTGVGSRSLLQGIFLTQKLNPSLLWLMHCQVDSSPLSHLGSLWTVLLLFSRSVVSSSFHPHGMQHARFPCPSPSSWACSNSCPLVMPSNHLILCWTLLLLPQSFPASGSFPMRWLFPSGSQSIGISALASVLPMDIQNWFPLGLTGLISLMSQVCSRVFSNTTVRKH